MIDICQCPPTSLDFLLGSTLESSLQPRIGCRANGRKTNAHHPRRQLREGSQTKLDPGTRNQEAPCIWLNEIESFH